MVCFKYVNNMSKKSETEYDSDSATISGSSCSSTARSACSSSHSSYQYSSTNYDSSSLRSSCILLSARKENEEQTVEACAAKEHSTNAPEVDILSDEDDILDKTLLERVTFDQGYINRRFYTAPLYGSKLLSSIPCTLHIIDEKDEYSTSDHSVHTSELTSKRSGKYGFYSDDEEVGRKITPRQLEVPPKKICIRKASPKIVKPYKGFHFKNISFTHKSTQVCSGASPEDSIDDSCRVEDISEEFSAKQTERTKKIKTKKERDLQSSSLPHSVSENSQSETVALEPNIVILDDDSTSSKSSLSSKGDAPNDNEIGLMNCCQPKNCHSRQSKSIFSALERYFKSSCEVSPYSPATQVLTTRISSSHNPYPLSSSTSKSDSNGNSHIFTSSATINLQERNKEPECQQNFSTTFDMKAFKEILGNYTEGVKSTRTFPLDFEDLEEEEKNENRDITFKEKGSQLICTAQNENEYSNAEGQSPNLGQISRRSLKSKLLVNTRRKQSTDVDFYYANCSSSSSEESLRSNEDSTTVTDVREIKVDSEYENHCCLCFRFLRLK